MCTVLKCIAMAKKFQTPLSPDEDSTEQKGNKIIIMPWMNWKGERERARASGRQGTNGHNIKNQYLDDPSWLLLKNARH
jgi:hypothetical protein